MAKAKKAKVKRKVTRKPKDPCGARRKKEAEHQQDVWNWIDELQELERPAIKFREVIEKFKDGYRAELMTYLGRRDDPEEADMYEDIITAFNNLARAIDLVEEASNRTRQSYVADRLGYFHPKTNKFIEVSSGRHNTTPLSLYKDT